MFVQTQPAGRIDRLSEEVAQIIYSPSSADRFGAAQADELGARRLQSHGHALPSVQETGFACNT
jgi:hypothetical protein